MIKTIVQKTRIKLHSLFEDNYFKAALGLFLIGTLLRFYKFSEFVTFLGDQGRDAIIIRRILTFEHFPAIGPTTSIGNVYLGPFYYYFISPWLLFSNFNPIGLALGVGFFSSLFIIVSYLVVKDLFEKRTALIFASLITFSLILIDFSRYSWNPNLLPLFSLLIFYFVVKAVKTRKTRYFILTGVFLSFAVQLHYIALSLLPAAALVFIIECIKNEEKIKIVIVNWLATTFSFLLFSLPLLIFDLRHDFLNSKNFLSLFFETGAVRSHRLNDLVDTFSRLSQITLSIPQLDLYVQVFLIFFAIVGILFLKKNQWLRILSLFFFIPLLITSSYSGVKHPHYLGALYPFYYLFISIILTETFWKKKLWPLLAVFMMIFVLFQWKNYFFLNSTGGFQIEQAKKMAAIIEKRISAEKYQLTGFPDQYSDSTYRYFLELYGKRPIEKDSLERGDELFVVCEGECSPIGSPQWDIAYFAPSKIVNSEKVGNVRIYKLLR